MLIVMEDLFRKHNCELKTLYINLATRRDRLSHVQQQLHSIGIVGERLDAIKMEHGYIGCTMSHIKCLELAIERNYSYVFICEDDITFTNPTVMLASLEDFLASKMEWDVLLLGGNNRTVVPNSANTNSYIKVTNCQTTTGYITKRSYMQTLLTNFKEGLAGLLAKPTSRREHAIDMYWKRLQVKDRWFLLKPQTVCQLAGYSDIEKRCVDYRHVMLERKK